MRSSGKLVVLSIFAVALLMAAFAWWWNRQQGRRAMEFWGRDSALAIRDGKVVELVKLRMKSGRLVDLEAFDIVESKDISQAQGLLHARYSLLQDASFDWEANPLGHSQLEPKDVLAVRFSRHDVTTTIVFMDMTVGRMFHSESGRENVLNAKTRAGWKIFIRRYFPDDDSLAPAKAE
ncbi:MAG: hypothetical protein IAF94_25380 [Pirellulaceae bacterium]|nr:hypothetical protein [Pirellulaceae bacterium]